MFIRTCACAIFLKFAVCLVLLMPACEDPRPLEEGARDVERRVERAAAQIGDARDRLADDLEDAGDQPAGGAN